jgi:hypothetical protein
LTVANTDCICHFSFLLPLGRHQIFFTKAIF